MYFERADRLHKRLKAARLDASFDAEMRKVGFTVEDRSDKTAIFGKITGVKAA